MADNKPIGQLLKELGFVTDEQIKVALKIQKANPKFLGEILEDLDFVTSSEIAQAIALQHNLEYINLEEIVPSEEALRLVPKQIAISKNILPIKIDNDVFIVATQEVNDIITLDYLRKVSHKQVKFVVGDKKAIVRFAEIFYYQLENPIEHEIAKIVKDSLENKDINVPYLVDLILNNAIKDRVTDIHIVPESTTINIFYRIDGVLEHYYSLPKKLHNQIVARIKIVGDLDISEQRKPQDGAFTYTFLNEEFDLRISTLPTNHGENIVIRLLSKNTSLFSLANLGLNKKNSKKIGEYFSKPYGIILVVGPTGSGKTTTLYSALRKINPIKKNIMTIEDPIEYKFSFVRQTQLNVKAGYTFDAAIKAFMRQDPDVMLIGEIRDEKTAELAVRASITGHLVLSTLHTNDAVGTIPRLIDLNIPPYLIGSGLLAVIAQRLVRKLCEHCKEKVQIDKEELIKEGISEEMIQEFGINNIYKPVGCPNCRNIGYSGRVAIVEILEIDKTIESLIASNASVLQIITQARKNGMRSIKEDGYEKVLTGITTLDEIKRVVN
ncbi:MAG: Flp pilus assembly complex ATPase component [Epsilonproteobacteria bacterium]|nr:Flp pilus assembly complex ATPase component [Campylobacterota bacterium]